MVSTKTRVAAGAGLAAITLLSACGSSGKAGGPSSPAAGHAGLTITVRQGSVGPYLTDGSGRALYDFTSDSPTKSTCAGTCLTYWPPVTATTVHVSGGHGTVGTVTRADGTKQVTFAGHPLYYFGLDRSAGDTKGQGRTDFGASWWLVGPSGASITAKTASSGSGSSTGHGY